MLPKKNPIATCRGDVAMTPLGMLDFEDAHVIGSSVAIDVV